MFIYSKDFVSVEAVACSRKNQSEAVHSHRLKVAN